MNKFATFVFCLLCSATAFAQLGFGPVQQNRLLEKEALRNLPKGYLASLAHSGTEDDCVPISLSEYYITSGDSIVIEVDTFGTGGGSFTFTPCGPIQFGNLVPHDTTTSFTYFSNSGETFGVDTICAVSCNPAGDSCTLFTYEMVVTRPGQQFVEPLVTVAEGEFVPSTCLDLTPTLRNVLCIDFLDIDEGYEGQDAVLSYFTRFDGRDSCFRYQAARIPGIDTVYLQVCDDVAVCDTFLVPFEVVIPNFGSLPFFDDFSRGGPYPDERFWLDDKGFVNRGMAPNPPSIGMVTLDGLDAGGSPYKGAFGQGDQLTSRPIDLSMQSIADDINLKFFFAPKGYGLYPNEDDSLTVEFRAVDGSWLNVFTANGIDSQLVIENFVDFTYVNLPVDSTIFFHTNFQFRFTNFYSPAGIYDNWHIDYIELSEGRGPDQRFADLAFTRPPQPMLKTYRHAPWRHIQGDIDNLLTTDYRSGLYNHFEQTITIGQSGIRLQELTTGTDFDFFTLTENALDNNIPPQETTLRDRTIPAGRLTDYLQGLKDQSTFPRDGDFQFAVEYDLAQSSQAPQFFLNDTVKTNTICEDYFAYDDGSAEWFVFLQYPQIAPVEPTAAVKFHTLQEDTLSAIQLHFPHANGDVSGQLFLLNVWIGELKEEPDYQTVNLLRPFYVDAARDSLQGYTNYRLSDELGQDTSIIIPADTDFYVGWQQVTVIEEAIPVGFDLGTAYDSINTEVNFVNVDGNWRTFSEVGIPVPGAVMLRPIMGSNPPVNTSVAEVPERKFTVTPNPTNGMVYLSGIPNFEQTTVQLYSTTGQELNQWRGNRQLDLSGYPSGLYFLQIRNFATGLVENHRILLQK